MEVRKIGRANPPLQVGTDLIIIMVSIYLFKTPFETLLFFFTGSTLEPSLLNVATAIGVSAEATTWPCI